MTKKQVTTKELSPVDIEKLSFEEALGRLEEIVHDLESGKETLESSIVAYSNGTSLKNHCEKKLQEAQLKVERIVTQANGEVVMQDFMSED